MIRIVTGGFTLLIWVGLLAGCKTRPVPPEKDPLYLEALSAYEARDFDKASSKLSEHLSHYPGHGAGYRYAAEVHAELSGVSLRGILQELVKVRQTLTSSPSAKATVDFKIYLGFYPSAHLDDALKQIALAKLTLENGVREIPEDQDLKASLFVYKLTHWLGLVKSILGKLDSIQGVSDSVDKFQGMIGLISTGDLEKALSELRQMIQLIDELPPATQNIAETALSLVQVNYMNSFYDLNELNSRDQLNGFVNQLLRDQMMNYLGKTLQTRNQKRALSDSIDLILSGKATLSTVYANEPELQKAFDPKQRQPQ